MSSYAFIETPGKAEEALRCFIFKDELNCDPSLTFAALIYERFTDVITVLIFLFLNIKLFFSLFINISGLRIMVFISFITLYLFLIIY